MSPVLSTSSVKVWLAVVLWGERDGGGGGGVQGERGGGRHVAIQKLFYSIGVSLFVNAWSGFLCYSASVPRSVA